MTSKTVNLRPYALAAIAGAFFTRLRLGGCGRELDAAWQSGNAES